MLNCFLYWTAGGCPAPRGRPRGPGRHPAQYCLLQGERHGGRPGAQAAGARAGGLAVLCKTELNCGVKVVRGTVRGWEGETIDQLGEIIKGAHSDIPGHGCQSSFCGMSDSFTAGNDVAGQSHSWGAWCWGRPAPRRTSISSCSPPPSSSSVHPTDSQPSYTRWVG